MLAYLRSPAFLALALDALVGADARPQALLARAPLAVMLSYVRSPAFLAHLFDAVMLAYLRPPAVFAIFFLAVVRASFGWHAGSCWPILSDCAHVLLPRAP